MQSSPKMIRGLGLRAFGFGIRVQEPKFFAAFTAGYLVLLGPWHMLVEHIQQRCPQLVYLFLSHEVPVQKLLQPGERSKIEITSASIS